MMAHCLQVCKHAPEKSAKCGIIDVHSGRAGQGQVTILAVGTSISPAMSIGGS